MANYIQDFQGFSVGAGLPAGLTSRWQVTSFSVIDESGDKILRRGAQGSSGRRVVTLDAVDADANRANVEVLIKLRVNTTSSAVSSTGAGVRSTGASSVDANGYACSIFGSSQLRIVKYIAGEATVILHTTEAGGLSIAANTWHWMRFRANGNDLKSKIWADGFAEPEAWTVEITDSDIPGAGGAGIACSGTPYVMDYAEMAVATNGDTAALSYDTTAPNLTSATGTAASATTAAGSVTTDEGNGTLFFLASTNATETAATVKTGGATGGALAISSTGVKNINVSGLTPSTLYYLHYVHRDAAGNDSARVSSSSFTTSSADVTAPTLSSTNENNGVVYCVVTTSATAPSAAQIRAGQNNSGGAAAFASNQIVSTTGTKSFSATGLAPSTAHYAHFHHRDASNNDSTVATSSSFTTAAGGTKGARVSLFSGASAQASLTGLTVCWWDITTPHTWGAPLLAVNNETTDGTGLLEISLAGVTALALGAKGFLLVYKADGGDSNQSLVFAGQVEVVSIT
jgi:hypothetical protein